MAGNIFKFAWRNIWRNKRRTFLTLLALAFGVMSIVFAKSYMAGIINSSSETIVKTQIGHIRIAHKEYLRLERILPKEHMVPGVNRLKTALAGESGMEITSIDPRIKFNVLLNHADVSEPAVAVGVVPAEINKTMKLSETIVAGRYFSQADTGLNLIIGKSLAKKLAVTVNDELLLVTTDINYSTYALPFKVAGIIETGFSAIDKHLLYIPLNKAQEMLDCGDAVHEMLVFLKNPDAAPMAAETIKANLTGGAWGIDGQEISVMPWQKHDLIETALPMARDMYDVIMGIIMLIVALVILNTMLMAVMERYQEIGVMKALGFRNWEAFSMILVEAFCIGTIGSVIGGILGGTISAVLEKVGMDFTKMMGPGMWEKLDIPIPIIGKVIYPDFTVPILLGALIFGILIALLAVLYPAFKSIRMQPVEAFRSQLKV
ncbi:MAG: ABC transporter permease [bacterium]|nr:ABC transporter permease [bacterium]